MTDRFPLSLDIRPVPQILGDAQWLKQAMINLLDNALRYTPQAVLSRFALEQKGTRSPSRLKTRVTALSLNISPICLSGSIELNGRGPRMPPEQGWASPS